jgi:hypothetical protein
MAYLPHCCAGNEDPGKFDSIRGFKEFMEAEMPELEQYCDVLWNSGFRSFDAITRALLLDDHAVLQLLDSAVTDEELLFPLYIFLHVRDLLARVKARLVLL